MKSAALAALLILLVPGCTSEETTRVEWTVRNDGTAPIDYEIRLYNEDEYHTLTGTLAAGDTATRIMVVTGPDLQAEARIVGDDRASSGVPTSIDTMCRYDVDAAWDGETWNVDVQMMECQ